MSVFAAIADPTRRGIVDLLARNGQLSATEISDRFSISSPAISQHLKVLREAGLLRVETRAQQRIYMIDPAGFEEIEEWLNRTRRFWSLRLDELEKQLKAAEKESRRKK
jgi:DNA-binding transcriptional ArsR family regulator